uniref:Uncharacterized protein n=1 Tax=Lynx canadensis TaxID=61383 RepID=A0A667GWK7_LYNCA
MVTLGSLGARIQQSRRVFRPLGSHLCEQRPGCPFSTVSLTPGASGVKQIMEEAVTRKFVHEDSSHIISFCGESMDPDLERVFFLCGLPWGSGVFVQDSHTVF